MLRTFHLPLMVLATLTSACGGGDGNATGPPDEQFTLQVTVIGQGTVTSSPPGITCTVGTCSESFPSGTSVILTATPAQDWRMSGWDFACLGTGSAANCVLSSDTGLGSSLKALATFTIPGVITTVMMGAVNHPWGLVFDGSGNLYVVDTGNHRVRKVASGVITTITGTGVGGFSGDGGLAAGAELNNPAGIAIDGGGNLYVADRKNHRIRKIDPSGIITTVAGTGTGAYGGDGGLATEAQLDIPEGVAVDAAGNLYIADRYNNRIRKVDAHGVITTIAGDGSSWAGGDGGPATDASLSAPSGLVFDAAGNLYIADRRNNRVRRIDPSGIITTVAGTGMNAYGGDGGLATQAQLNDPTGVAVDAAGNLYIADRVNHRLRRVDLSGVITTIAGIEHAGFNGDGILAAEAMLLYPINVAFDADGNLYLGTLNHLRKIWW